MIDTAVILAGGLGTRLGEETQVIPKPMVQIGESPILWHIMKIYSVHGIKRFVICLGYKGYAIKEYFANYFLHRADVTFDIAKNSMDVHSGRAEPWRVTLIETGTSTMTGGRLKRVREFVKDAPFCMTYGDGVADIDVKALISHHQNANTLATVTAVRPPGRFGALELKGNIVSGFVEKPAGDNSWINGGFFVLDPKVIDLIDGDDTIWERAPMEDLAQRGQLSAYKHYGFWQPMDTVRDRNQLRDLWDSGEAPWKVW
ncbi:MAG TPA: glucose-1-phosphate cytidylyltransferase [Candidatus Saccharimonadales bacterium]|nr:glucose-1-phosphate cytidylyltransferase [Candidatus Saccharimonadales bacterium]